MSRGAESDQVTSYILSGAENMLSIVSLIFDDKIFEDIKVGRISGGDINARILSLSNTPCVHKITLSQW